MTEWRNEDAELVARLVAATRPVRPRAGWRQEVWHELDAPRRSWGLALAAAVSFVAVMIVSWLPVWAADRAADRKEAASWAERWAVRGEILRVAGEVRAWERERAATVAELARNEAQRRALIADLALAGERMEGASGIDQRLDGRDRRETRRKDAFKRMKPSAGKTCGDANDPLCGL